MSTKPPRPFRMAPLQKLAVKPIDDPGEQAALDARLRHRAKVSAGKAARSADRDVTGPLVLELCRRLPAAARLLVATELTAQLSPAQRVKLLEHSAAQLPAEVLRRLTERLRGQSKGAAGDGPRQRSG